MGSPPTYNVYCHGKLLAAYLVKKDRWKFLWRFTDGNSVILTDQGYEYPSRGRVGWVKYSLEFNAHDPNGFPSFLAAMEDSKWCMERSYSFAFAWEKTLENMKERFINLLHSWVLWVIVISAATLLLKYVL